MRVEKSLFKLNENVYVHMCVCVRVRVCVYIYVRECIYVYMYICMSVSCHVWELFPVYELFCVYVLLHVDHNSTPNLPDPTPIYRIDQRICYFLIASLSLLLKLLGTFSVEGYKEHESSAVQLQR